MKKLLLTVCVLLLAVAVAVPASAQSKIALNIGADVLLPMGSFSDVQSVGFGGDVTGEYLFMPEVNFIATLGYYSWGGKDVSVLGVTHTGFSFHSIPFLVGAKYYFMPKSANLRFYGAAQIGLFFSGTTVSFGGYPGVTLPNGQVVGAIPATESSVSSTDFAFVPAVGLEAPISTSGSIDASVRFVVVSGSNSLGFRVGYKFPIGG